MTEKQFVETYCHNCGTQRCEGIGTEWFEGCKYKWNLDGRDAAAEIERLEKQVYDLAAKIVHLKAENDDLFYKLQGVMWFVDKWLEGDELEQDEVNRAIAMREKTLQITEEQQKEIEMLKEVTTNTINTSIKFGLDKEREINKTKSEAYKELAEELKGLCSDLDTDNINEPSVRILWDAEETIDSVVKELMEENK